MSPKKGQGPWVPGVHATTHIPAFVSRHKQASQFEASPDHAWVKTLRPPKDSDFRDWVSKDGRQKCESTREAEDRRDNAVPVLENGSDDAVSLSVAYSLCCKEERCGIPMEPQCTRRVRINFVGQAAKALTEHCSDQPLFLVTLVHKIGKCPAGELKNISFDEIVEHTRQQFIDAGLGELLAIGGNDISYNEDSAKKWPPHWQIHIQCVVAGSSARTIRKKLRSVYPRSKTIRKPVVVKVVNDVMGALSYCAKGLFFRRVSYIDKYGDRNTRGKLPLKREQFRELALFMAGQRLGSRFFFKGFKRLGRFVVPV